MREQEKVVSVRIPEGLFDQLRGLALIDNRTLASEMRQGLSEYVETRRKSPDFDDLVHAAHERQASALEVLRGAD